MAGESRDASEVTLKIRSSIQDHCGRGVTLKYTVMPTFKTPFNYFKNWTKGRDDIERIIEKIWASTSFVSTSISRKQKLNTIRKKG